MPTAVPRLELRWRGAPVYFRKSTWSEWRFACEELNIELVYVRAGASWEATWRDDTDRECRCEPCSTAQRALESLERLLDHLRRKIP